MTSRGPGNPRRSIGPVASGWGLDTRIGDSAREKLRVRQLARASETAQASIWRQCSGPAASPQAFTHAALHDGSITHAPIPWKGS
jgi:hypothetical protein